MFTRRARPESRALFSFQDQLDCLHAPTKQLVESGPAERIALNKHTNAFRDERETGVASMPKA